MPLHTTSGGAERPYVRRSGNQLAIDHGARDPDPGKVEQRIPFTLRSKAEPLEALGRRNKNGDSRFQSLLEHQHPELRFERLPSGRSTRRRLCNGGGRGRVCQYLCVVHNKGLARPEAGWADGRHGGKRCRD